MKKREANFELLRIVAMLMIITLHYLDKGGVLPNPGGSLGISGFLAWGLEAFCVSAVNVYVLMGAYFLAEGEYCPMRAVRLWIQTVFYSVGIVSVLLIAGIVSMEQIDKYRLLSYVFPVIEEHYWFATAYILMLLFAPLMNDGLRRLPEKTYQKGIGFLLLVLCVSKSVLPVKLPTDRLGYDTLWFLCLYLIGAYIRYYGASDTMLKKIGRLRTALVGYVLCSLLIFASFAAVYIFYQRTGSLAEFINRQYNYNSILCLAASVFLFYIFYHITIQKGRLADMICRAASASFGVYLMHEHLDLRYLWPTWLGVLNFADTPLFFVHWLSSIVAVYIACMAVDFCRQFLFRKIQAFCRLNYL